MSPLYDDISDFEVLFEKEGFQVSQYHGISKVQLVHRCDKSKPWKNVAELVDRNDETGIWKCVYCYQTCPDDVVTVLEMMR